MEDTLQPARVSKSSVFFVLSAGVLSAALVLVLLHVFNHAAEDFNIMGWYSHGILPIGAILVGMVAGSGYGLASWWSGAKIGRAMLLTVIALQVAVYFAAQHYQFRAFQEQMPAAADLTFWEYFDGTTRSFAWKGKDGKMGEPLDAWGYGIRCLEIAGFALGGLLAPVILMGMPYCEACGVYRRRKDLAFLPAGVTVRKVKGKDKEGLEAYQKEQQEAFDAGLQHVQKITDLTKEATADALIAHLAQQAIKLKEAGKLTCALKLQLQHCRRCGDGVLLVQTSYRDENQRLAWKDLFALPIPAGLTPALLATKLL